jgi:N-acetylglucosamine-6-phosphate deacetylase
MPVTPAGRADLVLTGARVLLPDRVVDGGWVTVAGGRITAVGQGAAPDAARAVDLAGDWLAPGYVDVHVHGGGGGDVMDVDPAARRAVRETHAVHGTTAMLASTVTAAPDLLLDAVRRLGEDAAQDDLPAGRTGERPPAARLLGVHLEGPFLAEARKGAHDPALLRLPDPDELARLVSAGAGWVRTITLAPELPGGLELVATARQAGLVVALGHTDADADLLRRAVDLGAQALTHTYNAMRPLHHRDIGAVGLGMDDARLTCELILDGHHVDPAAARALVRAAGAERVALVTDAMSAAGRPDGRYRLGGASVDVHDGRVVLTGADTLAGSTLTMGDAVHRAVRLLGVDVPTAVAMATTVPARLLGSDELGVVAVGGRADLVRLRADGALVSTYVAGREVAARVAGAAEALVTDGSTADRGARA